MWSGSPEATGFGSSLLELLVTAAEMSKAGRFVPTEERKEDEILGEDELERGK